MAGFHGCDPGLGHRRYDTTDVAAAMRDDPAALYEYDMTRSPTATLPASWMTHDATMRHYRGRSEEHTSELQSLMRISYAVFCLKKKKTKKTTTNTDDKLTQLNTRIYSNISR